MWPALKYIQLTHSWSGPASEATKGRFCGIKYCVRKGGKERTFAWKFHGDRGRYPRRRRISSASSSHDTVDFPWWSTNNATPEEELLFCGITFAWSLAIKMQFSSTHKKKEASYSLYSTSNFRLLAAKSAGKDINTSEGNRWSYFWEEGLGQKPTYVM